MFPLYTDIFKVLRHNHFSERCWIYYRSSLVPFRCDGTRISGFSDTKAKFWGSSSNITPGRYRDRNTGNPCLPTALPATVRSYSSIEKEDLWLVLEVPSVPSRTTWLWFRHLATDVHVLRLQSRDHHLQQLVSDKQNQEGRNLQVVVI